MDDGQIPVDELHETLLETALLKSDPSDIFQSETHAHYTYELNVGISIRY